jgi:uroporphyrinogen-III decarboxylase
MKARERLAAAIELEKPDRVPVGPLLDHFAATYCGITKARFMQERPARIEAILKTMRELGPWDMTFLAETVIPALLYGAPARVKWPGKDLPADEIHQFEEFELLTPEDYDLLIKSGLIKFLQAVSHRLHPELTFLKSAGMGLGLIYEIRKHAGMVRAAGAEPAIGFIIPGPLFEFFSLGRSMGPMSLDLFDRPEKIKAAGQVWAKAMTNMAIRFAKIVGIPRVFIGLSRSSPSLISPRHFEEFILPELDYMVHTLIDARLTPLFHMDTNWSRCLHHFRRFPAKKCIMELDGATDIFKAREIMAGHTCIMGDVPAYLLAFKPQDEVMAYCKRLIQEVGRDGGFILSSGCSIPANAKAENVRAMSEAVGQWGSY